MKAEAAQKKEDAEVARAEDAATSVEPSTSANAGLSNEPIIAEQDFADDTWPGEDMLTEDVSSTHALIEAADALLKPTATVDVATESVDEAALPIHGEPSKIVSALPTTTEESVAVDEQPEPTSKKDKKRRRGGRLACPKRLSQR